MIYTSHLQIKREGFKYFGTIYNPRYWEDRQQCYTLDWSRVDEIEVCIVSCIKCAV